jgi:beta-lactam-binding protein with PASTA domain
MLIPVIAGLAVLTSGSAAVALPRAAPGLTFAPPSAPPGQEVQTIVDVGDAVRKAPACAATWDGARLTPTCRSTDDVGSFRLVTFTVPTDAGPGPHHVTVTVLGVEFDGILDVPGLVAVPQLVGLTLAQAQQRASDVGLTLCEAPVGIVVRQRPGADALTDPRRCVEVVTKPAVFMPNILGKTLADARAVVEGVGLVLDDPGTTDGTVTQQNPQPGERAFVGSHVQVTLTAVDLRTVPDLIGHTVRDATGAVAGVGLRLRNGGSDPDRLVETQNPGPGAHVPPGTQVTVRLLPPPTVVVTVPDLRGETLDQARTELATAQLALTPPAQGTGGDARVASQSPTAGAQVRRGSPVSLTFEAQTSWPPSAVITAGAIAVLGLAIGVRALFRGRGTGNSPSPPPPPPSPPPPASLVVLRPRADDGVSVRVLQADAAPSAGIHLEAQPDSTLDPIVLEVPT